MAGEKKRMESLEVKGLCASYVLLGVPFAGPVVSWDRLYSESFENPESIRVAARSKA
jgi:hypothetical protein